MAKLNSGSVWQQSKYWLSIQTERSCYVCYCVLSVLSSQTQQQQQRRVLKKREGAQIFCLLASWCYSLFDKEQRKTFPLFHNYHLCALDMVSFTFLPLSLLCQHVPVHVQANFNRDSWLFWSLALCSKCVLFIHKHIWKSRCTIKDMSLCVLTLT